MQLIKKYFEPRLMPLDKDLKKRWFVEACEPFKNLFYKRVRVYGKLNSLKTIKKRLLEAEIIIKGLGVIKEIPKKNILQEWLETKKFELRKKSYESYESKIKIYSRWLNNNNIHFKEIECLEFVNYLKQNNKHNTTIGAYIVILKQLYNWLLDNDKIKVNYFAKVKKPKTFKTSKQFFTDEIKDLLIDEIKENHKDFLLPVMLLYYCFIRNGEQRNLKIEDVFLKENKILMRGEISKNKKTEYVSIPSGLKPYLEFTKGCNKKHYLLTNSYKQIGINYLNNKNTEILEKLSLKDDLHTFYSWKHTGAYNFVKAGGDLKQLQVQLRHHSLDQVNEYLRDFGITDCDDIINNFPII